MKCPSCQTENPADAEVCKNCGKRLREDSIKAFLDKPEVGSSEPALESNEVTAKALSRPQVRQLRPEEDPNQRIDATLAEAILEHGRNRPIISVIGLSQSGKTFFVNRLRYELPRTGGWRTHPVRNLKILSSPAGIELTWLIPVGDRAAFDPHERYLIADCAGESFRPAFEALATDRELDGVSVRSYLTALAFAHAYFLVITAEDLLGSDAEVQELSERFYEIVNGIIVAERRLQSQLPEEFLRQGISKQELRDIQRPKQRLQRPIHVIFSQADCLDEAETGQGYDADPFGLARMRTPVLFEAIRTTFEEFKFDFASAFVGHNRKNDHVNYELSCLGVLESFGWIHHRLNSPAKVSASQVVKLRQKVDTTFRPRRGRR